MAVKDGYTNKDVVSCELEEYGKPDENGRQKSRYVVRFKDGEKSNLRRVTTILDFAGGATERFKQWSVDQTLDALKEEWLPGTVYSEESIDSACRDLRFAHKRRFDRTGEYGTMAHDVIEGFLKRAFWPSEEAISSMPEPVQNSLAIFIKWWNDHDLLKVVLVEELVYDIALNYGGKLDFLAEDKNGNLILLDWKTSGGIYEKFRMQAAAYAGGIFMSKGIKIHAAAIVRFGKTDLLPQTQWISKEELREAYVAFVQCSKMATYLAKMSGQQSKANQEHKSKELVAKAHKAEDDKPGNSPVDDIKAFWRRWMDLIKRRDIRLHAVMADASCRMVDPTTVKLILQDGYTWHLGKIQDALGFLSDLATQAAKQTLAVTVVMLPPEGENK